MDIDTIIKQELEKLVNQRNENTPTPQELANNLGKHEHHDGILANVSVDLIDQAWKNDIGFYIGIDDKGIGYRRDKALANILSGTLKHSPHISVSELPDKKLRVSLVMEDIDLQHLETWVWKQ